MFACFFWPVRRQIEAQVVVGLCDTTSAVCIFPFSAFNVVGVKWIIRAQYVVVLLIALGVGDFFVGSLYKKNPGGSRELFFFLNLLFGEWKYNAQNVQYDSAALGHFFERWNFSATAPTSATEKISLKTPQFPLQLASFPKKKVKESMLHKNKSSAPPPPPRKQTNLHSELLQWVKIWVSQGTSLRYSSMADFPLRAFPTRAFMSGFCLDFVGIHVQTRARFSFSF